MPPRRFYLCISGMSQLSQEAKRDLLRHDADASQVFEANVQCKACGRCPKITVSSPGDSAVIYELNNWFEHKLICGPLQ